MPFKKNSIPWNKGMKFPYKEKPWKEGRIAWNKGLKCPSGKDSPSWKGDNAKYIGKHSWIKRLKGRADHCEHCGELGKKKYEWCNKDHKYKREVDQWFQLCTSCHRKYDMEYNNYNVAFLTRWRRI